MFLYCISFSKKGYQKKQHIHLKRHDRDPNSIPHSKHRAAWAYIIFMSFLHWDLKNLITLSENLFIEKNLAVIQTYNRFFKSGSFTGKTFCYITFSKAEKIMLWVWLDNAIFTNHRPIQDTMRKLLRKRPMPWPPEDNKTNNKCFLFQRSNCKTRRYCITKHWLIQNPHTQWRLLLFDMILNIWVSSFSVMTWHVFLGWT